MAQFSADDSLSLSPILSAPMSEPTRDADPARPTVAFPPSNNDLNAEEKREPRQPGLEMRREMTKDDKELAQAGYDHLEPPKTTTAKRDLGHVEISEHQLSAADLQSAMRTTFNAKDPGSTQGLSQTEVEARLQADGPNVLTPPKKKSALRKVCFIYMFFAIITHLLRSSLTA